MKPSIISVKVPNGNYITLSFQEAKNLIKKIENKMDDCWECENVGKMIAQLSKNERS